MFQNTHNDSLSLYSLTCGPHMLASPSTSRHGTPRHNPHRTRAAVATSLPRLSELRRTRVVAASVFLVAVLSLIDGLLQSSLGQISATRQRKAAGAARRRSACAWRSTPPWPCDTAEVEPLRRLASSDGCSHARGLLLDLQHCACPRPATGPCPRRRGACGTSARHGGS